MYRFFSIFVIQWITSNFELINIAVKNLRKKRNVTTKNLPLIKDALSLASNPKIDIVIELIGGSSGVAYKLVKKSLMNGKNKSFKDYKSNYFLINFFTKLLRLFGLEKRIIQWLELLITDLAI